MAPHYLYLISGFGIAEVCALSEDQATALSEAEKWSEHMRGHLDESETGFDSAELKLTQAYKWQSSQLEEIAGRFIN